MWEEYQHLHDQASTVNEEASAALARQEESTARRLTELKAWTQQQQAAARRQRRGVGQGRACPASVHGLGARHSWEPESGGRGCSTRMQPRSGSSSGAGA